MRFLALLALLPLVYAAATDVPLTKAAAPPSDWKNAELWCAPAGTTPPVSFTSTIRHVNSFDKQTAQTYEFAEKSASAPQVFSAPAWPEPGELAMPAWYPARPECKGAPALILADPKTTAAGFTITRTKLTIQTN